MLKDRYIHNKLGIPIQTLQNWKKTEGYTFLLYNFLVNQSTKSFDKNIDFLLDQTGYSLMRLDELTELVRKNWSLLAEYTDYELIDTPPPPTGDKEWLYLAALHCDSQQSLVMRFVSGIFDKEDKLTDDYEKITRVFNKEGFTQPKIVYVVNAIKKPKYFASHTDTVSMITYSELVTKFTEEKIVII